MHQRPLQGLRKACVSRSRFDGVLGSLRRARQQASAAPLSARLFFGIGKMVESCSFPGHQRQISELGEIPGLGSPGPALQAQESLQRSQIPMSLTCAESALHEDYTHTFTHTYTLLSARLRSACSLCRWMVVSRPPLAGARRQRRAARSGGQRPRPRDCGRNRKGAPTGRERRNKGDPPIEEQERKGLAPHNTHDTGWRAPAAPIVVENTYTTCLTPCCGPLQPAICLPALYPSGVIVCRASFPDVPTTRGGTPGMQGLRMRPICAPSVGTCHPSEN